VRGADHARRSGRFRSGIAPGNAGRGEGIELFDPPDRLHRRSLSLREATSPVFPNLETGINDKTSCAPWALQTSLIERHPDASTGTPSTGFA